MITTIPLDKLIASPRNVRRHMDPAADCQLKADIAARGLLQNLVVAPAKKPRGTFTVEAGGRRLAALKALAEEGTVDGAQGVPCLVLGKEEAVAHEASLAENFQRLAMNPADECLAFRRLFEQGADAETIARRFGLSITFVEGRLRLSTLAPAVFDALGAGEISLDVAKAYAATADRERQQWVFEQLGGTYAGNHPDSIRRMMTQATASATDPRALLVGSEAYLAAGGRIERDLFDQQDGERWLDLPLLERLAGVRMAELAEAQVAATGLGWVKPVLASWVPYDLTRGLRRVTPEREPPTPEEAARIAAAEAEIDELAAVLEDQDAEEELAGAAERTIAALEREIAALLDKPPLVDEAMKSELGAFLLLGNDGVPYLDRCFFIEEASETAAEAGTAAAPDSGSSTAGAAEPPAAQTRPLSRALVDELAMQRRDILAVHVAADPDFALNLATFLMVEGEAAPSAGGTGSTLSARRPADPVFGFKAAEARATIERATAWDALERSWTVASSRSERFDAFRQLPAEARAGWLANAVARTLEASANAGGRRCSFHDHLGTLLGIDAASWWRPTGANYFDRIPKAAIIAAFEAVGGAAFASAYAGMKKAELAQAAERLFAGELIAEEEVKARACAWVPEAMLFARPAHAADAAPETDDAAPPWDEDLPASGEEPGRGQLADNKLQESGEGEEQLDEVASSAVFEEAA